MADFTSASKSAIPYVLVLTESLSKVNNILLLEKLKEETIFVKFLNALCPFMPFQLNLIRHSSLIILLKILGRAVDPFHILMFCD